MMLMQNDIPIWPDKDSANAYQRFLDETFYPYKGCMIARANDGYKWNNKEYANLEDAKKAVDDTLQRFGDSMRNIEVTISHKNGTETKLQDEHIGAYRIGHSPYMLYRSQKQ